MKNKLLTIAFVILILAALGGCVRLKYWAFKEKYPTAGVWSFIISGGR